MALEQFVNNAATTLAAAITSTGATTISVTSAGGFPSSGNFRILIGTELLLVTGVSGTTFTVTRGVEGTTAATALIGATVTYVLTAVSLLQLLTDYGVLSQCLGDRKPVTAGTYDEEFEGTADTLPANWAWTSAPSGSDSWKLNSRLFSMLTLEGTGNTSYTLTRTSFAPAGDFGVWLKAFNGTVRGTENKSLRMYIENSGGTEAQEIGILAINQESNGIRGVKIISSVETDDGYGLGSGVHRTLANNTTCIYLGLTRTSNAWRAWYSENGITWQLFGAATSTHTFTVARIRIIMGTSSERTLQAIDWLRYRDDALFPRP